MFIPSLAYCLCFEKYDVMILRCSFLGNLSLFQVQLIHVYVPNNNRAFLFVTTWFSQFFTPITMDEVDEKIDKVEGRKWRYA